MHTVTFKELTNLSFEANPTRGSGEVMRVARGSKDLETFALCLFPKEAGGTTAQLDDSCVLGPRDRKRRRRTRKRRLNATKALKS